MAKHEHEWYPICYAVQDDGSLDPASPTLWSCSGRTHRGNRCIATITTPNLQAEERSAERRLARDATDPNQRTTKRDL